MNAVATHLMRATACPLLGVHASPQPTPTLQVYLHFPRFRDAMLVVATSRIARDGPDRFRSATRALARKEVNPFARQTSSASSDGSHSVKSMLNHIAKEQNTRGDTTTGDLRVWEKQCVTTSWLVALQSATLFTSMAWRRLCAWWACLCVRALRLRDDLRESWSHNVSLTPATGLGTGFSQELYVRGMSRLVVVHQVPRWHSPCVVDALPLTAPCSRGVCDVCGNVLMWLCGSTQRGCCGCAHSHSRQPQPHGHDPEVATRPCVTTGEHTAIVEGSTRHPRAARRGT